MSSIAASNARADLLRILAAGVAAVAPERVVSRALNGNLPGQEQIRTLVEVEGTIRLLAAGKAAVGMAAQAHALLGAKIIDGLIIAPAPPRAGLPKSLRLMTGAHPLPDATSELAGHAALDLVTQTKSGELVLLLLGGGASSMMCAPADGVSLADKIAVTASLMRSGATIRELNTVRKHLSALKGGGLLLGLDAHAKILGLILSDVQDDDLATIGSGPTVADPTTFADAIAVLKRRKLWGRTPETVRNHLELGSAGLIAETVKRDNPVLTRVQNFVVGNNAMAQAASAEAAHALGYTVELWGDLSRDAETVGRDISAYLTRISRGRVCVIAGGEPVVTVRGRGRGGRAQHCALATAIGLDSYRRNARICAVFAGTDGIDGPTDAAGAIVMPTTVSRGHEAGLEAREALAHNDSYPYFKALGDLLITGPTGTNVTDLFVALVNY